MIIDLSLVQEKRKKEIEERRSLSLNPIFLFEKRKKGESKEIIMQSFEETSIYRRRDFPPFFRAFRIFRRSPFGGFRRESLKMRKILRNRRRRFNLSELRQKSKWVENLRSAFDENPLFGNF